MASKSVDFGNIFGRAFGCACSLKRIVPFFVMYVLILAGLLAFLDPGISFLQALVLKTVTIDTIMAFIPVAVVFFIALVIIFFVMLYLQGGLIDNAKNFYMKKEVSFGRSLKEVRPLYLRIVGATLLTALLGFAVGIIPFIGPIFAIVLSWMFIVYLPSVVVGRKNAMDSVRESYQIFMENKLQTFLFWLLVAILGLALTLLSLVPVGISILPVFLAGKSIGILAALKANLGLLAICGIFTAFFLGYVAVFQESAKTFYYIEIKKRK